MVSRARIGINAHLLSGQESYRRAGIHHYIDRLLSQLSLAGERFHFTVFTNSRHDMPQVASTTIAATRWPTTRPALRIAWEQLAWPVAAFRGRLDLLHSMAFVTPLFSPCPTVVTVYDLSFLHYPDRFPPLQRLYLTSQTRRSCRSARRVVTISESGRLDVHKLLGVPLGQIDVVRPGVDAAFSPRSKAEVEAFRRRAEVPDRFILHVGTLQPRKNITILLEAFAKLERPDLELVLVGGKGWYYEEIFKRVESLGLQKRVRYAGYVPDAVLPLWYNAAAMLVFPSVYEGFGMPVAQAMACGTPVIAAGTSAVPEVAGTAARLFDPQDLTALVEHMAIVIDNPRTAATMRENGFDQSKNFSWQQAGRAMVAVYQHALDEG